MQPIIFTDFDGCLSKSAKIWTEESSDGWLLGKKILSLSKEISDHDSHIMRKMKDIVKIVIISADKRINKLWAKDRGIDFIYCPGDKLKAIDKYLKKKKLIGTKYIYLGDSIHDFPAMNSALLSFYPSDASLLLKQKVEKFGNIYQLFAKGGEGAFEEMVIELQERKIIPLCEY